MQLFDNETNHHSIFSVILFVYTVKFFDEEKHFLFIIRELWGIYLVIYMVSHFARNTSETADVGKAFVAPLVFVFC